jgi:hypothetical protein
VRRLGLDVAHAGVGAHGGGAHVPVDRHRLDLVHLADQPLVAQVAQHQQFGAFAQGHQRDQLALVDEDRQRPLGGDVDAALLSVLVDDADFAQQIATCLRQARCAGDDRPVGVAQALVDLG